MENKNLKDLLNTPSPVDTDKNISNNLGDAFEQAQKETKFGSKIELQKDILKDGLTIVNQITFNNTLETNKELLVTLIEKFYKGHHLEKRIAQIGFLTTNDKVVASAYNTYLSKEEGLHKLQKQMDED